MNETVRASIRDEIRDAAGVECQWRLTEQEIGRYARAAVEVIERRLPADCTEDKGQVLWDLLQEVLT